MIGRSPIGADAPDRRSLPVQPEPPTDQDDRYGTEGGDHFDNDDQYNHSGDARCLYNFAAN